MKNPFASAGLALGIIIGSAFFFGSVEASGWFSANTASWVQALGSVGAITGAAWIARRQSLEAENREARAKAEAARKIEEAIKASRGVAATLLSQAQARIALLTKLARSEDATGVNPYAIKALEVACAALGRFPIDSLQSPLLVEKFCRAEGWILICLEHAKDQHQLIDGIEDDDGARKERLSSLVGQLAAGEEKLETLIAELRDAPKPAP